MIRRTIAASIAVLVMSSLASAQTPRFHWQTGQVLIYRTEHATLATYVMGDNKSETRTRVHSTKRWQVVKVDADGAAILQMSLSALLYETTTPSGEAISFDSSKPEKSPEKMRKDFLPFIGQPLVLLRIDAQGKVLQVKKANAVFGSVAKFENEPPFKLLLPVGEVKAGQSWERAYQNTLEPPQGTGEKYPDVQRFACKGMAENLATIAMTTEVKGDTTAQEDQVPLWQMQPEGEIVFDMQAGRMRKATLRIDKEAKTEGGSTRFRSVYTEEYAGDH
jgi:hypothetical protein